MSKLILELYRAARETPVDEFQKSALALIGSQIPFRTAFWGAGEMTAGGLAARSAYLHEEPPEMLDEWVLVNHNDTVIDEVITHSCKTLIFHAPSRFSPPDRAPMLDYTRRFGHQNCMTVTTMSKRYPPGEWLSLYRANKNDHFDARDGRMLEQVMPHLVEALETNRLLGELPVLQADSRMSGIMALARLDGTLYHCSNKFTELLSKAWPEWKCGRLPTELMSALHAEKLTVFAQYGFAISTSLLGNMLLLKISKVSRLHVLSPREIEVAKFYAQGKSYKEIGLILSLAPTTVRCFLARVYTKLNISNKVELIALLSYG